MEWYVRRFDTNKNEIETMNVLYGSFYKDYFKKLKKKFKSKEEFATELKHEMMYHFWSRCEWELIIRVTEDNRVFLLPWCGCRNPEMCKIDVTDDPDFDWRGFANMHINEQVYKNEAKIDVYDQLQYVWDDFVSYCWNYK